MDMVVRTVSRTQESSLCVSSVAAVTLRMSKKMVAITAVKEDVGGM